ncbi:MAG: type II toxin-antitoxin system Phd/YefM family antitoxin [Calditrichaeota bacterium]|nr:MAG: type II toxin-antitoxin system Phd/YefM family antitoxin [Calditrichota bacterium]MBL1204955.1 type II toxin-antitoxin system Phd/YefM family antitoxin [Calditrichota bacterium]NOG44785.1 type II toxin-antitoxin system Phd/YefM family antitoxin [Calditrichota bacterium]
MKLDVSKDIVPIGEFKSKMTKWILNAKDSGHPIIVTQNGKPAAVVLSPEEFDKLKYTKQFIESVNQGLADIESGDVFTTDQLKNEVINRVR